MKKALLVLTAAVVLAASPLTATTIDFYTEGTLSSTTAYGNQLTASEDGIDVTVTGWSIHDTPNTSTSTFSTSLVRNWSTGLGMCNSGQQPSQGNCNTGPHATDNIVRDEYFLVSFSEPVLLTSAFITAWAQDYDATFWGGLGDLIMTATTLDALDAWGRENSDQSTTATSGVSTRTVDLTVLESPVKWLVFGARQGQDNDKFKFKSISFTVPEEDTPEPGVLALLAIGTALLAARSRKRS